MKAKDYSLDAGRYVGVVMEEDGKREDEFIDELLAMNDELIQLIGEAKGLEDVIAHNIRQVAGE